LPLGVCSYAVYAVLTVYVHRVQRWRKRRRRRRRRRRREGGGERGRVVSF
jgi:membrane protein implicated in regulation of membrane protease activity